MPDINGELSEEEIKKIEFRLRQVSCSHPKPEIGKRTLIFQALGRNQPYHVLTYRCGVCGFLAFYDLEKLLA